MAAFTRMSRMLLNSVSSDPTGDDSLYGSAGCGDLHGDGHAGGHDADEAFLHVYKVMAFVALLWFAGKAFSKLGMPELVGEIVFGILLGPHVLNFAGDEGSEFLIVIGEIGLVMLVVEAGIDVDIGMLKLIGPRGVGIAVLGSIIPMSFGFCLSYLGFGTDIKTSIAIGACFAPTSMGIALNVLKKQKMLNTPTGQLIIASAILDDVIALIILSELGAMKDPTPEAILLPLIVSPVLILGIGYLAVSWIPKGIKLLMVRVPKQHRENAILGLLFATTFAFVPMCHYVGSSYLLGAFLSGLCFCTDHTIHHVWHHQIKRVLQWMLRIFFSATIGFAIPIKEFGSSQVIIRGLLYCICGIGKVVTGFFVMPLTKKEFFVVGWSMSAWGEFAFILATASFAEGTIDQESFAAVLLAVLLSVIYSPYFLSMTIKYYEKQAQKKMDDNLAKYKDSNLHPLYFAINTRARGKWGHQDKILKNLFNLNLEIIDFRSWHAPEYNHSHHQPLTKESFYVQDMETALPPTKHLNNEETKILMTRVKQIRYAFKEALGEKAVVGIKRWLPGVTKSDDELDPTDAYHQSMFGGEYKPKHKKTAEYCRQRAFKQAHSMISMFERKSTLEDLARKSKASLHSMYSTRTLSDVDREKTMAELGKLQSLTNLLNATSPNASTRQLTGRSTQNYNGDDSENHDDSLTFSDEPRPQRNNNEELKQDGTAHPGHPEQHIPGMGHFGQTGAGGAGALPVSDDLINIVHSHFVDDSTSSDPDHHNHTDQSHMSYIYGDEDSQHHKLPEYSAEHLPENHHEPFQQKLSGLAEDDENDHRRMDGAETSDQDTSQSQSKSDDTKPTHNESNATNKTLISLETPVTGHSNADSQHMDGLIVNALSGDSSSDLNANNNRNGNQSTHNLVDSTSFSDSKLKKALTIKIYPPALQAVASQSPAESEQNQSQSPINYVD